MKRFFSTVAVFGVGVLITYFLSDFYNDIEDRNRTNFSREESNTLKGFLGIALGVDNVRGHTFASALKIFPGMGVNLTTFREFSALPESPPVVLGAPRVPRTGTDRPLVGSGAYQYLVNVQHSDRSDFEEEISKQWNRTIEIIDYNTLEVVPPKDEYWVVFLHMLDANVIGRDVLTDPDRSSALNFLLETGNVSYSSPVISTNRGGIASYSKFIEVLETPLGRTGCVGIFTPFLGRIQATNIVEFLEGGNKGRRVTLEQVQNGVKTLVYEDGSADDLIYEGIIEVNEQTHFVMKVYDNKVFDNTEPTLIFMGIGILVSIAMAAWEFFRSSASLKAFKTSVAKSKFLSNISHEIRTPINGIVGISDVLSKEKLDSTPKGYVDIIVSCSSSLLSLLNNVLDMSKIDAGKMENNKRDFSLRTLMLKTLRDSWGVVHAKNPNLKCIYAKITPNVPISIFGNDTHIFQVLNNLVSNASKFTDDGYIEVTLDAKTAQKGINISLAVRDTGCGMSPEAIKKLFKPFSQVHNSNNSKDGTGLGLMISMNLTKAMGGGIVCESEVGVGTTFTATFSAPGSIRNDNIQQELVVFDSENNIDDEYIGIKKAIHAVDVVLKEGLEFLVVDDNMTNQLVIKKMLESIGATNVDVAGDGKDSLNLTNVKRYDMIFMDKFMPSMNGIEATENIRKDTSNLSNKSHIIFLSADTEDESISKCMMAGANEFIGKPYRMEVLIDKMYKVDDSMLRTVIV